MDYDVNRLRHLNTIDTTHLQSTRTFDPYVYFDWRSSLRPSQAPPLYWRLLDPEHSLLEIGIDRRIGVLLSLTLTFYYGELIEHKHNGQIDSVERILGIPSFALGLWPDLPMNRGGELDYVDVQGRVCLKMEANALHIILFNEPVSYQVNLLSQQTSCDFNANRELCGLWLHSLTDSEIHSIKEFH